MIDFSEFEVLGMNRKRKQISGKPGRDINRNWMVWGVVGGMLALVLWLMLGNGIGGLGNAEKQRTERTSPLAARWKASDTVVYARYAGSESCRECHEEAYSLWQESNHYFAERPIKREMDHSAFNPPHSFQHGTETSEARIENNRYEILTMGFEGRREAYAVERVLGHDPLRQFLVRRPNGRYQVTEAAYDPHRDEWFDVYGDEDRRPGEWGHWTGRGMNWNSMCATCHNTRLRKHYQERTDTYATSTAEMSVGCEACHGPLQDHVTWQYNDPRSLYRNPDSSHPDPTLEPFTKDQMTEACGACHSRRSELSGEFVPGDRYFDHFRLVLPDESDLYYADGQVRGENYVFGSFLSSRMYAAGVRCMDCHQIHSTKTLFEGNLLCMRCHNGGYPNSPVIDETTHSFHKSDNDGYLCVNCHMPQTIYMQRHPRRDHGFTIPDPWLTKHYGIPNACNRCHQDKEVDWALDAVEEWYGDRMKRHTRRRALWIANARQGKPGADVLLLQMLQNEDLDFWKAVAAGMLDSWAWSPAPRRALLKNLSHTNALIRVQAAQTLEPLAQNGDGEVAAALEPLLEDEYRSVRLAAAWSLRDGIDMDSTAGREMHHFLGLTADQPSGALQQAIFHLARGNRQECLDYFRKAVKWEPNSALLHHEFAVAYSTFHQPRQALQQIQEACRLEPGEAEYQYKLGLAYNEIGRLKKAAEALEKAVELDPRHARAWYNLGLARNALGRPEAALTALLRGESSNPEDPRIPYARATILIQLGRLREARTAAARALEIQPNYPAALNLLRSLERG